MNVKMKKKLDNCPPVKKSKEFCYKINCFFNSISHPFSSLLGVASLEHISVNNGVTVNPFTIRSNTRRFVKPATALACEFANFTSLECRIDESSPQSLQNSTGNWDKASKLMLLDVFQAAIKNCSHLIKAFQWSLSAAYCVWQFSRT